MPLISLEKLFVGFTQSLFSSSSLFKARKCHFLPFHIFSNTTCIFLVKLNFEMYSGLKSINSTSQGTYKIIKAMSSLYFSNLL